MRRRRGDGVDHRLAVAGRDEHLSHRADQAQLRPDRAARADGIEPVLRTQLRRDVARAKRNADDAPVAVARGHRIVTVEHQLRAVEGPNSELDDACTLQCDVIARTLDRWRASGGASGGATDYTGDARSVDEEPII